MGVVGLDHVAFPTERPEEMIAFYRRLGFAIGLEEEWRAGTSKVFFVQAGDNRINIHGPELYRDASFTLRGTEARPGCGDVCFAWEGDIAEAKAMLEEAGAEIVEGPVRRWGGRPSQKALSVYTRDPDGNLLEFLAYAQDSPRP